MTYAFVQDVPINVGIYRGIVAELGDEPPEGLIVHVARVMEDGHLQYLDVWKSEEAWDRFVETRLHPVVGSALARAGVQPQAEPPQRPIDVVHVWAPAPRAALLADRQRTPTT